MNNTASAKKLSFNDLWQKYGTFGILLVLVLVLAILRPSSIFSLNGITQILTQSSVNILLALGEFFAILIAGIDLSVSSMAALTGVVTAKMMVNGVNPIVAILLGVLFAALLGLMNGFLVSTTGLHPFIVTLGTQSVFRGFTIILSEARSVFGFPSSFTRTISTKIFGILPVPVLVAIVVAVILTFFTTKTKGGRNIYALGGNKEAAWVSGINVKLHTIVVFLISGTCAGIAGVILLGRVGAAEPGAATGFETYAIAASIIGGTSFFGGKGKIFGVFMGGLIIGLINYGMTILNVPSSYQYVVMGVLIIGSVFLDHIVSKKR